MSRWPQATAELIARHRRLAQELRNAAVRDAAQRAARALIRLFGWRRP